VQLSFFDCNCTIGRRADRREGEPWTVEQLLAEMNTCGITEAVVTHAMCRDYDPHSGNLEITRVVQYHPNLHGSWAILPPSTGELPAPEDFVSEMLDKRIVAAVAYPRRHNYSLSEWSMGRLLSALENRRIPLILPFGEFTWEEVERVCAQHLYLPIIVRGINYRQLRFLLPLWEMYRNLFVDISWFSVHDGLAYLAGRGLLRQMLFGTNYPLYEPGTAVTMVTYADINEKERLQVAGGTLREIIRGIRGKERR
jgi:hypothetical protein